MSQSMSKITQIVKEYYQRIDANDVAWVLQLFSQDAVYHRADSSYHGKAAITTFFSQDRKIRGRHVIDAIRPVGEDAILVLGRFEGVGHKGDSRQVGFSDVWYFDDQDMVTQRRTYLAMGSDYVKA